MSTSTESKTVRNEIRNVAIIAHVDHGKTTLIDALLRQSGAVDGQSAQQDCLMDSNDLERERGITIFSKCASIQVGDMQYNIIDTPGHADFGSEVERILKMVDGALLLVDAFEGPMPQTKFVLRKSLELGLRPIVVINKMDRPDQRATEVADLTFALFDDLGAQEEQLDFPIIYASGRDGVASADPLQSGTDMKPLLEAIRNHVPAPHADDAAPLQMLITMLDYDSYVGRIAIGRIHNGNIAQGETYQQVQDGNLISRERIVKLMHYNGMSRVQVQSARAGDVVAVAGFREAKVGATIASLENPQALPSLKIDEPTISMCFGPNTSPLSGRDQAKFLTSRQIRDRLLREAEVNVGLKVQPVEKSERMQVSGRGELHLSILIETMRRESFEFEVSRPEVIIKDIDGVKSEPIEHLFIDVETQFQGPVMEELGKRKAELLHLETAPSGLTTSIEFYIPSRSLLGFRNQFLTLTRGTGIMNHTFHEYAAFKGEIPGRKDGVMVAKTPGTAVTYGLFGLQERGVLFVTPGTAVYEGMIVGTAAKGHDMTVNATRQKKLTNVRASGKDDALALEPPKVFSLEDSLNFIEDDELVEITPKNIRLRKKILSESGRRQNRRTT